VVCNCLLGAPDIGEILAAGKIKREWLLENEKGPPK
jgi:hypothetical protein